MNNKELQTELAQRLSITQKEAGELLAAYVEEIRARIREGETELSFLNMGVFDIRQKEQKIMVNPVTKKRMLIPPKMTLAFKASQTTKNRYKGGRGV